MPELVINTGANAHLLQNDPGAAYPVEDLIYVLGGIEDEWIRGLLSFDFSALPAEATVTAATLALYRDAEAPEYLASTHVVHQLTGTFDAARANWTERSDGVNWSSAGGDYVASPSPALGNASGQYVTADVTALIAAAIAAELSALAVLIRSAGENDPPDNSRTYHAFGESNPPRLTIVYNLPAVLAATGRMHLGTGLGM